MITDYHRKLFCAVEDGHFEFSRPFVRAGCRYSTDGRMLLCEPVDEPDTPGRFPDDAGELIRAIAARVW